MNLMRRLTNWPQICILSVVFVLYGLAFNTYVPPTNGDDVTYFHGALSIAAGDGFKEQGKWIVDWPPVQSCLVAAAMILTGVREYFLSKIINGFAVLASLLLAYRVMVSENRSQPLLSCILIAIFPTSLLVCSAGQADATYFALSMLFFLLVAKLRTDRRLFVALLCGCILGATSLTRWQGVVLGVCLVFQALNIGFQSKPVNGWGFLKAIWLEILASSIGAAIFLAWKVWIEICIAKGTSGISNYEYLGALAWGFPKPLKLFAAFLNLLTQLENVVLTLFPAFSWSLAIIVSAFLGICVWGAILRIKQHGWLASDAFVVCTILLLSVYEYKESRYGIPIAPFLLDYLFRGLRDIHSRIVQRFQGNEAMRRGQAIAFFSVWIAGLLAFDSILLFYGDGESMGPACQLLLTDNRDYLRGYHRDLYDVCKRLPEQYPNAIVASDKFHKQMIRHYSGLETHFVGYAPDAKFTLFVEVNPECMPKRANDLARSELEFPPSLKGRLSNPRESGLVTLWDVDAKQNRDSN